ncbi:RDD family protein [Nocardioides terrisoli]|uniref:RDD family protein n=1 Tax=Nocardioides terrisoli TaxID=3388267 RepID=UPI00287B64FF|nr:RDD family protein [Nocardioides marmorisolisilvae]
MSGPSAPPPAPAGLELASWGRRIGAVLIDGVASALVALAILGPEGYSRSSFAPLIVFFIETGVGTAIVGGSFGQMLTRIRVLRTDGKPLSLLMALLRSLMVCLVIPPLVFRPDGRGLHDMATGSAAYRLPKAR